MRRGEAALSAGEMEEGAEVEEAEEAEAADGVVREVRGEEVDAAEGGGSGWY